MTTGTPTDAELLARLAGDWEGGGREALAALYRRHEPSLRGFLARFHGADDPRIDDWMHDTFLTAQAHAARFRGGSALPWLLALAARRVRDARRADRRRSERERVAAAQRAERSEPRGPSSLDEQIEALDERDRVLVELRFVQGLSHAEVADVLGVSLRTAKTWAASALDRLRERIASEGEGGGR